MRIWQAVVPREMRVELREIEFDPCPGDNEILIQTDCSFISAGTELAIYTGTEAQTRQPGSWCAYPFVPGYANAGRVLEVGKSVREWQAGDRVFSFGPHASHFKMSLEGDRLVAPIPDALPASLAAASRMAHVSITALEEAKAPGMARWVGVWGLGIVGNLAAQLFQIAGGRVIGIDPAPHRRELGLRCGCSHAIGGSDDEVRVQIEEITGGQKLAMAVDAVGHGAIAWQALQNTADYGQTILLGSPRTPVAGDFGELFGRAHLRCITVSGALEWTVPARSSHPRVHTQGKRHEAIMAWLEDGRLQLEPLLSHQMPAAQIGAAYEGLLHRKDEFLGVVLDWRT